MHPVLEGEELRAYDSYAADLRVRSGRRWAHAQGFIDPALTNGFALVQLRAKVAVPDTQKVVWTMSDIARTSPANLAAAFLSPENLKLYELQKPFVEPMLQFCRAFN